MLKFKDKNKQKHTKTHNTFKPSLVSPNAVFFQLEADAKRDFEMALKSGIPGQYLPNCWDTIGYGSVGAICTPIKASNKFHVEVEKICSDSTWHQTEQFFFWGGPSGNIQRFQTWEIPKKKIPTPRYV